MKKGTNLYKKGLEASKKPGAEGPPRLKKKKAT